MGINQFSDLSEEEFLNTYAKLTESNTIKDEKDTSARFLRVERPHHNTNKKRMEEDSKHMEE